MIEIEACFVLEDIRRTLDNLVSMSTFRIIVFVIKAMCSADGGSL